MATIAIGDVHGNFDALNDLLSQLKLEVCADDDVVFLGDYIDRGAHSKACVDAVLELRSEIDARVVCLCGNHEDWFLQTLHDHHQHSWLLGMDGLDTILSYSSAAADALRAAASKARGALYTGQCALPYHAFFDCVPAAHIRFFESLRTYYRSDDCVCTHAGLDCNITTVEEHPRHPLLWGARGFPDRYAGTDTVVYGHWNNAVLGDDGWPSPAIKGRTIGIDTVAHGVLTAIRIPGMRVFQSARFEAGNDAARTSFPAGL